MGSWLTSGNNKNKQQSYGMCVWWGKVLTGESEGIQMGLRTGRKAVTTRSFFKANLELCTHSLPLGRVWSLSGLALAGISEVPERAGWVKDKLENIKDLRI